MKKLLLLILILASNLFAQGWNNIVTTGIIEPNKTDLFTNSAGIHILVQLNTSNNIVYYNLNSAGVVCTTKTCTLETNGSFPKIVGTNDKIYAIYKTVNDNNINVIRVRYSTDNGSSWLTDIADRQTTANYCNGVDAVYQEGLAGGVHIVWATQDGGASGFETYYARLTPDYFWVEYKNVTDDAVAQYGGNPTVVVSPNRVHVSFNTDATTNISGIGDIKTRDKFNGNWQTPHTVVSGTEQSVDERLLVRGEFLYLFYYCLNPENQRRELKFRTKSVDNTTGWSGFTTIDQGHLSAYEDAFEVIKTTNDYIHILCMKHIGAPIGWAYTYKYSTDGGTNWFTLNNFDDNPDLSRRIGLSSVSNDLFCTWVKTGNLRFRQYDAAPLAPTNFTVSVSANNHPLLSWTKNNEADLNHYQIYKWSTSEAGWVPYVTTQNNSYEDPYEGMCPKGQYCEYGHNIQYKVLWIIILLNQHPLI